MPSCLMCYRDIEINKIIIIVILLPGRQKVVTSVHATRPEFKDVTADAMEHDLAVALRHYKVLDKKANAKNMHNIMRSTMKTMIGKIIVQNPSWM